MPQERHGSKSKQKTLPTIASQRPTRSREAFAIRPGKGKQAVTFQKKNIKKQRKAKDRQRYKRTNKVFQIRYEKQWRETRDQHSTIIITIHPPQKSSK